MNTAEIANKWNSFAYNFNPFCRSEEMWENLELLGPERYETIKNAADSIEQIAQQNLPRLNLAVNIDSRILENFTESYKACEQFYLSESNNKTAKSDHLCTQLSHTPRILKLTEKVYQVFSQALRLQREAELLDKIIKLNKNNPPPNLEQFIDDFITQCSPFFIDEDFLFQVMVRLALKVPQHLIQNLGKFPIKNQSHHYQIGILLKNRSDRNSFCEYYKIDPANLEAAYKTAKENNDLIDDGMCVGHTFLTMNQLFNSKETWKVAIQIEDLEKRKKFCEFYQIKEEIPTVLENHENLQRASELQDIYRKELADILKKLSQNNKNVRREDTYTRPELHTHLALPKQEQIYLHEPMKDFYSLIDGLDNKKGMFYLSIRGTLKEGGATGHAIFLSLDPPAFSDINSRNYLNGFIPFKTFDTIDDLLDNFCRHWTLNYSNYFIKYATVFSLFRYPSRLENLSQPVTTIPPADKENPTPPILTQPSFQMTPTASASQISPIPSPSPSEVSEPPTPITPDNPIPPLPQTNPIHTPPLPAPSIWTRLKGSVKNLWSTVTNWVSRAWNWLFG